MNLLNLRRTHPTFCWAITVPRKCFSYAFASWRNCCNFFINRSYFSSKIESSLAMFRGRLSIRPSSESIRDRIDVGDTRIEDCSCCTNQLASTSLVVGTTSLANDIEESRRTSRMIRCFLSTHHSFYRTEGSPSNRGRNGSSPTNWNFQPTHLFRCSMLCAMPPNSKICLGPDGGMPVEETNSMFRSSKRLHDPKSTLTPGNRHLAADAPVEHSRKQTWLVLAHVGGGQGCL